VESIGGASRPSAFAVFILINNSNLMGVKRRDRIDQQGNARGFRNQLMQGMRRGLGFFVFACAPKIDSRSTP
jgi:hypothetical protein